MFCVTFVYFGDGTFPKKGRSTKVLENHLKIFISIKIDMLNPNLHVISSDYEYVKRYRAFEADFAPKTGQYAIVLDSEKLHSLATGRLVGDNIAENLLNVQKRDCSMRDGQ